MLYSEFVENTECKDNKHNYEVYRNLEVMYMNSDLSKETIYEYGKKLVDNSKTAEEIALEQQINAEIAQYKEYITNNKLDIERYQSYLVNEEDAHWKKVWKASIKSLKEQNKELRNKIAGLKWVLAA